MEVDIKQVEGKITMCQNIYITDILSRVNMSDCKPIKTPIAMGEKLDIDKSKCEVENHPY